MIIAKIFFDKDLYISITNDTLIDGSNLDSKRPDLDIKQLIATNNIIEITNDKYIYFLDSSKVKFIKILKTK